MSEDVKIREALVRLIGPGTGTAAMESSKQSAQKIKNRTTVCSGNSTPGICRKKRKALT